MPPFDKKRVHVPADATADDAARPAGHIARHGFFAQNRHQAAKKTLADGYCHQQQEDGTLIHNGFFMVIGTALAFALSPGSLSVSLVKPCFESFAVSEIGRFQLTAAGDDMAQRAAIALPAITTAADVEYRAAFRKTTN
jgi:hypothetical protein